MMKVEIITTWQRGCSSKAGILMDALETNLHKPESLTVLLQRALLGVAYAQHDAHIIFYSEEDFVRVMLQVGSLHRFRYVHVLVRRFTDRGKTLFQPGSKIQIQIPLLIVTLKPGLFNVFLSSLRNFIQQQIPSYGHIPHAFA
jgi:hypothetical protein